MKLDKKIKGKLVEDAEEIKQGYVDLFNTYIKDLNLARSVEGIMVAKSQLLLYLVCDLSATSGSCYFCLLHTTDHKLCNGSPIIECSKCKYAKYHKICSDSRSDFRKLIKAQQLLMKIISYSYYKGEKYQLMKMKKEVKK